MSGLATLEVNGAIATLRLCRAESRNALSIELLESLHARVDELAGRDGVTVLVVTGDGRAFCAGMDLKQVLDGADTPRRLLRLLADLTLKIRRLPMVVVARVNGAAIGGGCGLACVCDLAATHADARLGFPEVDLGLCPAVVSPWLVRKIGMGRARAVLLRGGLMTGSEAHGIGIVDHVAADREGLDDVVDEITSRLSTGGPMALRATKGLLNEIDGSLDDALLHRAADLSADVLQTQDAQQRLKARLQA